MEDFSHFLPSKNAIWQHWVYSLHRIIKGGRKKSAGSFLQIIHQAVALSFSLATMPTVVVALRGPFRVARFINPSMS